MYITAVYKIIVMECDLFSRFEWVMNEQQLMIWLVERLVSFVSKTILLSRADCGPRRVLRNDCGLSVQIVLHQSEDLVLRAVYPIDELRTNGNR